MGGRWATAVVVVALAVGLAVLYGRAVPGGGIDACDAGKLATFNQQLRKYDNDDSPSFTLDGESLLGECAFRTKYADARALFRQTAAEAGFELGSIPIEEGSAYTTDVAIKRGHPKRFVVHVSGIHGVEGYAGSAAQVTALKYFGLGNPASKRRAMYDGTASNNSTAQKPPTMVFIHAINPFGMAHNRRVNEGNIDVNRNFLTDEQLAFVHKRDPNFAGYVDIDFLLNPTYQIGTILGSYGVWLSDLHGLLKVAYAVLAVGIGSIKRSLVAGNYYKPLGMGFGGLARSSSVETLIRLSKNLELDVAEKVVLIDVHTGLGPSGVDTLVYFGSENAEREAQFRRVFPIEQRDGEVVGGLKESSKGAGEGSAMAGYGMCEGVFAATGAHSAVFDCPTFFGDHA